jgi:hypothetical protein
MPKSEQNSMPNDSQSDIHTYFGTIALLVLGYYQQLIWLSSAKQVWK